MNHTHTEPRRHVPRIIPRSEHKLSRANVSSNALKVLYRLKNAGYAAYIVGGGVRDLLLEQHPKDFDVVTDAHPDEVRRLFKNCRLIGRRFRLAHVRFGRDVIEVATFRAEANGEDDAGREHSESGRILRDNVYGAIEEDIWRRDFTVNALYYNIADFSVVDYTSGIDDINSRVLRLIGDPRTRYQEDPVRMLRAVRLAAKLNFTIAPESAAPIAELAGLLGDVPPARLFDEVLKLFLAGYAVKSFELVRRFGLLEFLVPALAHMLRGETEAEALAFVMEGLRNTDERVAADKPVTPMFLFAVFLWPAIRQRAALLEEQGEDAAHALGQACAEMVAGQQARTTLPKRFSTPLVEMLLLQRRFMTPKGARAARLLEHKLFRAAYDFLLLRSGCGEVDPALATWWTEVQSLAPEERQQAFGGTSKRRRRGGRRRRARAAGSAADGAG